MYVAPPDHHLIVEGTHLRLLHGAKENFARPAIDWLFRRVAAEMGPRAIGVILTALLDDGAAGLDAIQSCGGATIVQDPAEAFAGDMPLHASPYADYVLPLDGLANRLVELAGNPPDISTTDEAARRLASEQRAWTASEGPPDALSRITNPSALTCPECGGTLWRLTNARLLRYRIKKELREHMLFAHHNVLSDPPFSRLDLICCRNLLIYLDREAQIEILKMFHFALLRMYPNTRIVAMVPPTLGSVAWRGLDIILEKPASIDMILHAIAGDTGA
nr:chemotaxis protein CheB [Burkholderia stagnalis]